MLQSEEYYVTGGNLQEPWLDDDSQLNVESPINAKKSFDWILCMCSFYPSGVVSFFMMWIILPSFFLTVVFFVGSVPIWNLPIPTERTIEKSSFSHFRAFDYMEELSTKFPQRFVCEPQNLEASSWIMDQLTNITSSRSNMNLKVEIEFYYWTAVPFQNARNVLARVSRVDGSVNEPSVMVSSHFDAPPLSPGAADDGMMVGTMLELFNNILNDQQPIVNPVIFGFFNGEEAGLFGSRAMMKDVNSTWLRPVERFMNLDASGNSGKVLLFRASPSSIVSEYRGVPYPHANVIGEEIMEYLPADTDYSAFIAKDAPFQLKGMDFATYQNGYKYHTRGDQSSGVSRASIHQNGENILYMLRNYAYNKDSMDIEANPQKFVYFDFVGIYFSLGYTLVNVLNVVFMFLAVCLSPCLGCEIPLNFTSKKLIPGKRLCVHHFGMPFLYCFGYGISIGFALLFAVVFGLLTSNFNALPWYGSIAFGYLLYGLPTLFGLYLGQFLVFHFIWFILWRYDLVNPDETPNTLLQRERHVGMLFFFAFLTFIVTVAGIRTGYVFSASLVFLIGVFGLVSLVDLVCRCLLTCRSKDDSKSGKLTQSIIEWIYVGCWDILPILAGIGPAILTFDLTNRVLLLLIPIMGRAPGNVDVTVAFIVSLSFSFIFIWILPYAHRTSNFGKVFVLLVVGSVLVLFVSVALNPYSEHAPKRYNYGTNLRSRFNVSKDGVITQEENYIFTRVSSLDLNPANYMFKTLKDDSKIRNLRCNRNFCDFNTTIDIPPVTVNISTSSVSMGTKYTFEFGFEPTSFSLIETKGDIVDIPNTIREVNGSSYYQYKETTNARIFGSVTLAQGRTSTLRFFANYMSMKFTPLMNEILTNVTTIAFGPLPFRITTIEHVYKLVG